MFKKTVIVFSLLCMFGQSQAQEVDKNEVSGLPVIVLQAPPDDVKPMVLFITGDGGWKNFDPKLAGQFVDQQVPVVALNALHYFWDKKTPQQTAATAALLLEKYMKLWHKKTFILVGFSFGADVMPFIVNRLPGNLMNSCAGVALFSPGTSTDFEIHLSQMMNSHRKWKYDVVKEVENMKDVRLLCFFGAEEHNFPTGILSKSGYQVIYLQGGHHYEDNKLNVGQMVLKKLQVGKN